MAGTTGRKEAGQDFKRYLRYVVGLNGENRFARFSLATGQNGISASWAAGVAALLRLPRKRI